MPRLDRHDTSSHRNFRTVAVVLTLTETISSCQHYTLQTWNAFLDMPLPMHLLIIAIFLACKLTHRFGMWPYSMAALPGTASHELSHWILAKLFFARPTFPHLLPVRDGRHWTLGSISFVPSVANAIPVALAPLLLFPAGVWYAVHIMMPTDGAWLIFHGWVASSMFLACTPSRQDWKVATPALIILAAIVAVTWWVRSSTN